VKWGDDEGTREGERREWGGGHVPAYPASKEIKTPSPPLESNQGSRTVLKKASKK